MSFALRRGALRVPCVESIGWGVLGPGRIARSFAADLALVPDGRLVATGSRVEERAAAFAAEFGGRAHGSYEELVADPEVDVVYVASPHALHDEHPARPRGREGRALREAGDARCRDHRRPLRRGRGRGLFLMEAMWMACHPMIRTLMRLLASRRVRHPSPGPRRPRVRRRGGADRPDARPGRWGPAHCSTWASTRSRWLTSCSASPSRLDGGRGRRRHRHRPRRRHRRPLPRRGHRRPHRVDDLLVAADRDGRHRSRALRPAGSRPHTERVRWTSYAEPEGVIDLAGARRARHRSWLRQRDRRGAPLPARGPPDQRRWCRPPRPSP